MFVAVVLAAVAGLIGAPPASAGGSWLELAGGDDVLIPGEVVTMSGTFGSGQQAAVSAGPWLARLQPVDEGGSTIVLGPVSISEGPEWGWRATVTFTVPTAPTGDYLVAVVNGEGEGVGDLVGGYVQVAPSLEAWRVSLLRQRLERQQRVARKEVATARDRLADVRAELAAATVAREELADRAGELERALDDARKAPVARDSAGFPWMAVAAATTVLALVLGLARVWRRRTTGPSVAVAEARAGSLP